MGYAESRNCNPKGATIGMVKMYYWHVLSVWEAAGFFDK